MLAAAYPLHPVWSALHQLQVVTRFILGLRQDTALSAKLQAFYEWLEDFGYPAWVLSYQKEVAAILISSRKELVAAEEDQMKEKKILVRSLSLPF